MTEEELADLLAHHLDTLLEGGALPADLPAEVADLLTVAQNLSEAAPTPRPEFGSTLKESLFGPSGGGNGSTPPTSYGFGGPIISVVVVAVLVGAAILALVISVTILGFVPSNQEAAPPVQTQVAPTSPTVLPVTPSPVIETSPTSVTESAPTSQTTLMPPVTATPIIDVLPVITVTIEIIIEPPSLVPGSGGGNGSGNGGGGGDGDHDRGHGNDSDGNDEDNPGKGDDD